MTGRIKSSYFCERGATALLLLFFAIAFNCLPAVAKSTQQHVNTFNSPDFAFPKTVEKNADKVFNKAIADHDGLLAIKSAIQLDIANSLISNENFISSANRFELIADKFDSPYSNIALLLEAEIYYQLWQSNAYKYNSRVVASDSIVENDPFKWDKSMFADKISGLVHKAISNPDILAGFKLEDITDILVDYDDAVGHGFSIYDFLALRALPILGAFESVNKPDFVLPFGSNQHSKQTSSAITLINEVITRHANDDNKFPESYFLDLKFNYLDAEQQQVWLNECLDKYGNTEFGAPFIVRYCQSLESNDSDLNKFNKIRRDKFLKLSEYKNAFPDAYAICKVNNEIESLLQKNVNFSLPSQVLPDSSFMINLKAANLYDFKILVCKVPAAFGENQVSINQFRNVASVYRAIPVNIAASSPDFVQDSIICDPLPAGRYALVASANDTLDGICDTSMYPSIAFTDICDLDLFIVKSDDANYSFLYVVDAKNQKPVVDKRVGLYVRNYNKWNKKTELTTDKNGCVKIDLIECQYRVEAPGVTLKGTIYNYPYSRSNQERKYADILTDLAIYKPGDQIRFSTICYAEKNNELSPLIHNALDIALYDANWQKVDSISSITDNYGRLDGVMTIPATGLLGSYNLRVTTKNISGNRSVEAAEYKTPTFYVTLDSESEEFNPGSIVKFRGCATTYTGLPVANVKVAFKVEALPLWWRVNNYAGYSYGGELATDSTGKFEIELDTKGLINTPFINLPYKVSVDVTDSAGESQQSPSLRFSLSNHNYIRASIPERIKVENKQEDYVVSVYNIVDRPIEKQVSFRILSNKEVVDAGSFNSPAFKYNWSKLPSGQYSVQFSLDSVFSGNQDITTSANVILYRESDKLPPVMTPLWVPENRIIIPANDSVVKCRVGSSYQDSMIFAMISDSKSILECKWLKVNAGFVEIPVNAPAHNERVFIYLRGLHNLECKEERVTIIPHNQISKLNIKTESFRNSITPGSRESWKFKFELDDKPLSGIAALAVMSDKALNSIYDFKWVFNPSAHLSWRPVYSVSNNHNNFNYSYYWRESLSNKNSKCRLFSSPDWQTYGYSLFVHNYMNGHVMMKSMARATSASNDYADNVVVSSAGNEAIAECAMAANADDAEVDTYDSGVDDRMSSIRPSECPSALFMPDLVTDNDGIASLNFTAPEFVGTWQLQIAGYDACMKGNVVTYDVVATKQVMAKLNAPRFARTGDKLYVSANLFNNSSTTQQICGKIEFFNPLTNDIIAAKSFPATRVEPAQSVNVTYDIVPGDDLSELGIRVYAVTPDYSDGEQTIIPILPASSPVLDSYPFYLSGAKEDISLRIPKLDKDAKVTLNYCNNPVWECVTALPALLAPKASDLFSTLYALYGNAVANTLIHRDSRILEGIKLMSEEDSVLISNLNKNPELKSVALNNTPWVNDAAAETLRMQQLLKYANPNESEMVIESLVKSIAALQNSDGGWSWCKGMSSSEFTTMSTLARFAAMQRAKALPDECVKMAKSGFTFLDRALMKDWDRSKRKSFSLSSLLNYLYIKSEFPSVGDVADFKSLKLAALKKLRNDWRALSIPDKAKASLLFHRLGEEQLSRIILESLRQFASQSPEKGMWFDNQEGSINTDSNLAATTLVLRAFAEVEPGIPDIDRLRQYLVVCKQVQNWGDNRNTVDAIDAILTTGTDWIAEQEPPQIRIGEKLISVPEAAKFTGAFTISLPTNDCSEQLMEVSRTASSPAWGSIMSQYVAPIAEIEPHATPQLMVEKRIFKITTNNLGTQASLTDLHVGDRVRVSIFISCDRDLEYVAVTDNRAACLEPVDQLSEYTAVDNVWMYREVRNESTNLFIQSLRKGKYVVSYDCFVTREGEYANGIVNAQSLYAPAISAHSAGDLIITKLSE